MCVIARANKQRENLHTAFCQVRFSDDSDTRLTSVDFMTIFTQYSTKLDKTDIQGNVLIFVTKAILNETTILVVKHSSLKARDRSPHTVYD